MDNLGSHTAYASKKEMKRLKLRWIFNVPYSPQWNPIELTFSQIKKNFKDLRAKKFMGHIHDDIETMITKSVTMTKKKDIVKCVNHVLKLLN